MTAVATAAAPPLVGSRRSPLADSLSRWTIPTIVAMACAVAFAAVSPGVGDLWAALARESAATNGVGLTYWFSWFDGGSSPGSYSVLTPYLSSLVGASVVGALATVAITPLCWRLVRGSAHPAAATWIATIVAGLSLWSGRIPFAVGSALSIAAFLAVRRGRPTYAAAAALLTVLASPVSGAFIVLGLIGPIMRAGRYRKAALAAVAGSGGSLLAVAVAFGVPGPEHFSAADAAMSAGTLLVFLLARPTFYVRVSIYASLALCPLLVMIPNGLGSNFERYVWIYLPVAVIATAGSRLKVAALAVSVAVLAGAENTATDLYIARQPNSSAAYYQPLIAELGTIPAMNNYRLEVATDGTHTSAYALLGHAMLARGYETQADDAYNAVLMSSSTLNPVTFKIWLDNNAVGFVALSSSPVTVSPEYELISHGLPYLTKIWSGTDWSLFRVQNPTPVVPAPATVLSAGQSDLVISVPDPATIPIRVRWSRYLSATIRGSTRQPLVSKNSSGWAVLSAPVAGTYVLHG